MANQTRGPERASEPVEQYVKQLLVCYRAAKLYPPASEIPLESAGHLLLMLRDLLREQPDLRLQVTKEYLLHNSLPVLPDSRPFGVFAREFYNRNVAEMRFHTGATPREVVAFLRLLAEPPTALGAAGGLEQRLWDQQVDGITVTMVSTKIVDADLHDESDLPVPAEDWPPSRARVDEMIEAAYGGRPRDQRMLVRFTENPKLVSRYLNELASEGRGGRPLVNMIAGRVVSLARAALAEVPEDPSLYRSIAESLLSLDPETRRSILIDRLLPDSRLDEAVANVMRQFELSELCKALVEGVSTDPVSRDGLSRALRNLAVIGLHPKEDVIDAAGRAMREAGMDEGSVNAVLDGAAPASVRIPPTSVGGPDSVESILRLVDLAPVASEALDEGVAALRAEVAEGVSDGDILVGMVTLVTIERRPEMFASLMSVVEDGIGLLLEWGEYSDAANAAKALRSLDDDETLDAAQHSRVHEALAAMAHPKYMRDVAAGVRVHEQGTPEHDACLELIATLGGLAIVPLVEVLADEPDMAARKALVDMIAGMAPRHIGELGRRTGDPRWYFVRNIVGILGSTRSPSALPHLSRTLRHSDARVRRETIRAAASIKDRLAEEMLVAALSDEDGQNVALAARYLGSLKAPFAVPALAAVARADGRGSREIAPRIEAIEALGTLGTSEAVAALADVSRHRGILRGSRGREIQSAIEAALARAATVATREANDG